MSPLSAGHAQPRKTKKFTSERGRETDTDTERHGGTQGWRRRRSTSRTQIYSLMLPTERILWEEEPLLRKKCTLHQSPPVQLPRLHSKRDLSNSKRDRSNSKRDLSNSKRDLSNSKRDLSIPCISSLQSSCPRL